MIKKEYDKDKTGFGELYIESCQALCQAWHMYEAPPMDYIIETKNKALSVAKILFNHDKDKYLIVYIDAVSSMAKSLRRDDYFRGPLYKHIVEHNCKGIELEPMRQAKEAITLFLKAKELFF